MRMRSPLGLVQATSTIRATVMRENCAIWRTRGPADPPADADDCSGDDFVCWVRIRSQTVCTSPLVLAVNRDRPDGEKDRKLQPSGVEKVVTGWRDAELPSVSMSMMDMMPGSLATTGATAPCVGGN